MSVDSRRLAYLLQETSATNLHSSVYELYSKASDNSTPVADTPSNDIVGFAYALEGYCKDDSNPKKSAILVYFVCQLGLYPLLKQEWREMEPMISVLAKTDVKKAINFAHGLSAIAREMAGHLESQRILDNIKPLIPHADPYQQYAQLASQANNAKDHGSFKEAEELYKEALAIGRNNGLPLAPVLFQLGRLELELERDLNHAINLFDKALKDGFEEIGTDGSWEIRVYVSKIQTLFALNNIPEAIITYKKALKELPPDRLVLPAESGLQHALIALAAATSNHLAAEWLSRTGAIGHIVSGQVRERDAIITEVARAMTNLGFPSEVEVLFRYAQKDIESMDLGLSLPSHFCNTANAHRLRGDYDSAIPLLQKAASLSEESGSLGVFSELAQLALVQRLKEVEDWKETYTKIEILKNVHNLDNRYSVVQLGYLDAIDILEQSPEILSKWPEELRRSKFRWSGDLEPLQKAISRRVEMQASMQHKNTIAPGGTISIAEMNQRGLYAGLLMNEGYLSTLKSLIGLGPQEILKWVFSDQKSLKIQKRIFLESLVDFSGNTENLRYSNKMTDRNWIASLPIARALMARWLYETTKNTATTMDLSKMRSFYNKWGRTDISGDLIETQRINKRKRNIQPGFKTEDFDEFMKEFIEDFDLKGQGSSFQEAHAKLQAEFTANPGNFGDSKKMGLHENNYLDYELFDVINNSRGEYSIFALDLIQLNNELIWVLVKLGKNYETTYITNRRVEFSSQKASEMAYSIQSNIQREQSGLLINPHLHAIYRSTVYEKMARVMKPLSTLMSLVPNDSNVYLRLSSPWSAIPIEQLPAFDNDLGLIDKFRITRLDKFQSWMNSTIEKPILIEDSSQIAAFGFDQNTTDQLPILKHHKVLEHIFNAKGVSGKSANCEAFLTNISRAKIVDFFGHGELTDGLGAREIFIIKLADSDLLAQEIVAKDLSKCSLLVLNSCRLAMHEVDKDRVTSAIPNFADHLIGGGIKSVIAALHVLNANDITDTMSSFYRCLAQGQPLSLAARESWGLESRVKANKLLMPVALFGADQTFNITY